MFKLPLLPYKYKKWGWLLLTLSIIAFIAVKITKKVPEFLNVKVLSLFNPDFPYGVGIIKNNITDELIIIVAIIGSVLIVFTKEKIEDAAIGLLRLNALFWAVLINYVYMTFATATIYEFVYMKALAYNIYTTLFIYIIRFKYLINKGKKFTAE
jgi:hypothetical protein